MSIAINVIAPFVSGLFFLLFFLYFLLAKPLTASAHKYFLVFLASFSIFLFGRLFQLFLGPHPMPLIVCNLRFLLLCFVCVPVMVLTTGTFTKNRERLQRYFLFSAGLILGVIYWIFNTLSSYDSYEFLRIGNIIAYDNLSPSFTPPFYGREVTLAVMAIIGLELIVISTVKIWASHKGRKGNESIVLLFNYGMLCLGVSFGLSAFFKQWWLIYVGSVISAIIASRGLILDIKDLHFRMDRLIPFIKEELFHNLAFSSDSPAKVSEMWQLVGKESFFNTFVTFKINGLVISNPDYPLKYQAIKGVITDCFGEELGKEDFLMMPLGSDCLGVCLALYGKSKQGSEFLINLTEQIREVVMQKTQTTVTIGIGRSYNQMEDLRLSFHESLNALEYALKKGENHIVHVNMIETKNSGCLQYPRREREELLLLIRNGKVDDMKLARDQFMIKLTAAIADFDLLKIKIDELIHLLIEAAIQGGGEEEKLLQMGVRYFKEISLIDNWRSLIFWFQRVSEEITMIVANTDKDRSNAIVKFAKRFIEENYQKPITVNDVAKVIPITPSYLMYLFKQKTGLTFGDYLSIVRMKKAKDLLENTELTIFAVAYEVGYQDANYFSRLFKNSEGVTPSAFKNRLHRS